MNVEARFLGVFSPSTVNARETTFIFLPSLFGGRVSDWDVWSRVVPVDGRETRSDAPHLGHRDIDMFCVSGFACTSRLILDELCRSDLWSLWRSIGLEIFA